MRLVITVEDTEDESIEVRRQEGRSTPDRSEPGTAMSQESSSTEPVSFDREAASNGGEAPRSLLDESPPEAEERQPSPPESSEPPEHAPDEPPVEGSYSGGAFNLGRGDLGDR